MQLLQREIIETHTNLKEANIFVMYFFFRCNHSLRLCHSTLADPFYFSLLYFLFQKKNVFGADGACLVSTKEKGGCENLPRGIWFVVVFCIFLPLYSMNRWPPVAVWSNIYECIHCSFPVFPDFFASCSAAIFKPVYRLLDWLVAWPAQCHYREDWGWVKKRAKEVDLGGGGG